MYPSEKD